MTSNCIEFRNITVNYEWNENDLFLLKMKMKMIQKPYIKNV